MKKKWPWILLIIIGLFVFGIYSFSKRTGRGIEVKTQQAARGDILVYLSTSGTIGSKDKKEYYVMNPSKVIKVNYKVGDRVKKGDIIAELETQDMSIQLKTAQNQYEIAKIQLNTLKEQRDSLKSASEAQPAKQSVGQQGITQQTGNIDNQIKIQENQVEIARLNIENIKQAISKQQRYIKSDIDGTITALNINAGGMTSPQMPSAVVEDIQNLKVNINVNQFEIPRVKVGQDAVIKFNDKSYNGKISAIDPAATKVVSASGQDTVIKVTADLLQNDGSIKSGFDVDVDIKTGEKKDVVKIPAEAVITDKENNEKVFVVENGKAILKNIKTGLSSDVEYEVTEGIKPLDKVILNPSVNVVNGARVIERNEKK